MLTRCVAMSEHAREEKAHVNLGRTELLGYMISMQGIRPQRQKTETIWDLAPTYTIQADSSFVGMAGYIIGKRYPILLI